MVRLKPLRPTTVRSSRLRLRSAIGGVSQSIAEMFEMLADWMETGIFQFCRVLVTISVILAIAHRLGGGRELSGGLNAMEMSEYGQLALWLTGILMFMAVVWSGSVCDSIAGVLIALIDDPDNRPIKEDPMDRLSRMIHDGRIRRARRVCKRMIRRHEGSREALQAVLIHLDGRKDGKILIRPPRVSGGK
jgi:hypothetical protein